MPRGRKGAETPLIPDLSLTMAPCVAGIRAEVTRWRERNYEGITGTTRTLLNHWFLADHRLPDGRKFAYHPFQREAIETLIYLYEVKGARRQKALLESYAAGDAGHGGPAHSLRLLRYDDFARYCVKMATGTGKTKVMALAVAWQYFNAVAEPRDDYAKSFLIVAPNVIVFERLRKDFGEGRIFKADPVIPPELEIFWEMQVYLREQGERAGSQGALYLTNIQQLYDRPDKKGDDEPAPMAAVMGPRPPANMMQVEPFDVRLAARGGPLLVINDEAHHTHDEDSEWNGVIRRLHAEVPGGLAAQLDFTATPRHSKGALFTWTVFDYPLKQAIQDGIVKRPIKGITRGIEEQPSKIASTRFQAYLTAGVERWREYRDQLAPLARKPVLFVMLNSTKEANEVGDWLRGKFPEDFAGEGLQVIHTDTKGEVSKSDLDAARQAVREIDEPDNPIRCIVSVLMLREGWDVNNVTVVVGLRPYTAKANILPEQTIGRGLRLMFRDLAADYQERVDVIGNKAFIDFVADLEREEGSQLDTFEVGKDKLRIVTILPDPGKLDKDISLPVLSPVLVRKKSLGEEIAALDVAGFASPVLPLASDDSSAHSFRYEGRDLLTLEKLVDREYHIPEPQTAEEVIGYYAQRIAQEVKLPSQFAVLVPKVREFLATKAFGRVVDLSQGAVIKAISTNVAHYVTVRVFGEALRGLLIEAKKPQLLHAGRRLSETPPFPFSRLAIPAAKTVFNLVPCVNDFEKAFARFLEHAEDVEAFAKLPEPFGFYIEYTDSACNLRYYEPDFVAVAADATHYLLETKGREDVTVQHKDRAAELWCENASRLTGVSWRYVKVPEKGMKALGPAQLADLVAALSG
ncbi:MAG TPA: DEAD/DEAH box helicase family protein [Planctomycetota bacterium]|nr:DEAD/DEAH box helicase family protein [Planctomycetota bacterium]